MAKSKPKPRSGRCQICRCTENRACEGGCSWVDRARTLCSACACTEPDGVRILQGILGLVGRHAEAVDILAWTPLIRARVLQWAGKTHLRASDNPVRVPAMPRQVRSLGEVRL